MAGEIDNAAADEAAGCGGVMTAGLLETARVETGVDVGVVTAEDGVAGLKAEARNDLPPKKDDPPGACPMRFPTGLVVATVAGAKADGVVVTGDFISATDEGGVAL